MIYRDRMRMRSLDAAHICSVQSINWELFGVNLCRLCANARIGETDWRKRCMLECVCWSNSVSWEPAINHTVRCTFCTRSKQVRSMSVCLANVFGYSEVLIRSLPEVAHKTWSNDTIYRIEILWIHIDRSAIGRQTAVRETLWSTEFFALHSALQNYSIFVQNLRLNISVSDSTGSIGLWFAENATGRNQLVPHQINHHHITHHTNNKQRAYITSSSLINIHKTHHGHIHFFLLQVLFRISSF